MSIKKYEIFLQTADLGSLTRAAHLLGYTQSAISHMIASLEEELGVKLLLRGRSGVKLSEEGERLLPALRRICLDQQELLREVDALQGLETGLLRIGTILSVSVHLLPRLLQDFSAKHPGINFELLQGNYEDISHWLAEGRIDCGFLRLPTEKSFETLPLLREKFLAIFPEGRALPEGPFAFEQLQGEPYILRPDTLDGELARLLKKAAYRPKITYSAKDDFAVMALVEQGLGMSILPELLMKDSAHRLQKRELSPPILRELALAHKPPLSPVGQEFWRFVKYEFQR